AVSISTARLARAVSISTARLARAVSISTARLARAGSISTARLTRAVSISIARLARAGQLLHRLTAGGRCIQMFDAGTHRPVGRMHIKGGKTQQALQWPLPQGHRLRLMMRHQRHSPGNPTRRGTDRRATHTQPPKPPPDRSEPSRFSRHTGVFHLIL